MTDWLVVPTVGAEPERRISLGEYRRRVKAMPYVWKRWGSGVALYERDGQRIAGVEKNDIDRFFTGLLLADASTALRLEASGGEVTHVKAEDLVAFILAYAKVAFGRPGD